MRMSIERVTKSGGKGKTMKRVPLKKKKLDAKTLEDSISETISFVIKGKLTSLKPKVLKKKQTNNKDVLASKQKSKVSKDRLRTVKTRQHMGASSKSVTQKTKKNKLLEEDEKVGKTKRNSTEKTQIIEAATKAFKVDNLGTTRSVNKTSVTKKKTTKKMVKKYANKNASSPELVEETSSVPGSSISNDAEKISKQEGDSTEAQTCVKKCNKASTSKLKKKKPKSDIKGKFRNKANLKATTKIKKQPRQTQIVPLKKSVKKKIKEEPPSVEELSNNSDEVSLISLRQQTSEKSSLQKTNSDEHRQETPKAKKSAKAAKQTLLKKVADKTKSNQKQVHKNQLKANNRNMYIMKKRLMANDENRIHKTKLFGIWNGPKRHRVASLNAIAKVHCLYENETRGALLDADVKRDIVKKEIEQPEELPTRNLRAAPRLGGVGKHWDMHEMFSSSSEDNESVVEKPKTKTVVKKSIKHETNTEKVEKTKPEKKRRRNRTEIIMDLKDMVVRKRMASLNATAILAASYSTEKKSYKGSKSDETDSTDSEESYTPTTNDSKKKEEEEELIKKEEDKKVIELRATPNKKVSVILNQDTDVTITGVYVNSTTRSTHHEGYCSIAGMQYRISATSHTQTAATAMTTENILQTTGGHDNAPEETAPPSSKSYTPLGALSSMKPPGASDGQHSMTLGHSPHLGPPHMVPVGPPQHGAHLSPVGRKHGCSSAFSAPPSGHFGTPPGHGHPVEHGYAHGYYQPAGPLINAPPQGHPQQPPPPPPPTLAKAAPLSESSTSPTPPPPTHRPPPPSSATESSDSDVIITSPPVVKEPVPSQQPPPTYRYSQYSSPHHGYSYSYPSQYYPTPPPAPSYAHHDLCYSTSPYLHKAYPTAYRRYLPPPAGTQFFQASPPDLYNPPQPTANPPGQQMVAANPPANGTTYQPPPGGPPHSALIESYAPPPALLDPYPPPPHHYYPGYGPAPPPACYTHSPQARTIPYLNAAYSSCPCPMQSCPKNVHAGPLTGDSKRSAHISTIAKDSVPLPPVALALPLEPVSATGPPSPARGSAGMPPPPSPAGATYQPPPPAPKQEATETPECKPIEKCRKARIGKNMVRNNIAANFPENTMLLMCHAPQQTTNIPNVKREIESPEETKKEEKNKNAEVLDQLQATPETVVPVNTNDHKNAVDKPSTDDLCNKEHEELENVKEEEKSDKENEEQLVKEFPKNDNKPEELLPCLKTVAENVKMKNMKRKLSMTKETEKVEVVVQPPKKVKMERTKPNGSYKDLIKKDVPCIRINNGKRKLIGDSEKLAQPRISPAKTIKKKPNTKRKLSPSKEETVNKRLKLSKPLMLSNLQFPKQSFVKSTKDKGKSFVDSELSENKEPSSRTFRKIQSNSKSAKKLAPAVLDNLFAKNGVQRTIETVISGSCWDSTRTNKKCEVNNSKASKNNKCVKLDTRSEPVTNKSTNNVKIEQIKQKVQKQSVNKKTKRKDETVPLTISRPRKSALLPRWSNGWTWDGEPFQAKVFLNSDETTVIRKCYPAMVHAEGDRIETRDCVLLKAGQRKNELPFVAKIAALWENPEDGEMMVSLLWYYRPEHTEQGRQPTDEPDEVFASRHKDTNSVACIEDKCYVLTFNEYCRYRKNLRRLEEGLEETNSFIPNPDAYPRENRQPPNLQTPSDLIFFCRRVYDFRQKRIVKNPS